MNYYKYYFRLKSDQGEFLINVVSYSLKSAKSLIMKAEGCPERAIEFSSKESLLVLGTGNH